METSTIIDTTTATLPDAPVTRKVGAFLRENTVQFVVWAPKASSVVIEISTGENSWQIYMNPAESGYWEAETEDIGPGCRYGYYLDDQGPYGDPASRYQPAGVNALSAVIDPESFTWTDHEWQGMELRQMIIYELHTGTFTEAGTFDGIIEKLDYLTDLGINAIEIMPVAQYSGSRGWGYDGVYSFAVQNSYGGPDALKRLVDACHAKGVAVILDVVYNHLGPEGNYLPLFGPYTHTRYQQGWGDAINFDNQQADHVRSFFIQNALMWLSEYHIDGLRLDAVHSIWDFGARHFLEELSEAAATLSLETGKTHVLIAESDLNDARLLRPREEHGFGLSGQWLDDFHHALHTLVTGERQHYYADYGTIGHLQKAFEESYVYNGNYSPFRERKFGNTASGIAYHQFVVYAQNHDQVGNRLRNDRLTTMLSTEMLKVVAGTYLLSPYVPMLFMGEEYGETNPFYYFIDYSDEPLIEAVRKGRKEEFAGFQEEGVEYADPQSEETFRRSRLSWSMEQADRAGLREFYRNLISIRKTHPALAHTRRGAVQSWVEQEHVLGWLHRPAHTTESWLLCLACFGKSEVQLTLPENKTWQLLIDSANGQPGPASELPGTIQGPRFMAWTSVEESV